MGLIFLGQPVFLNSFQDEIFIYTMNFIVTPSRCEFQIIKNNEKINTNDNENMVKCSQINTKLIYEMKNISEKTPSIF